MRLRVPRAAAEEQLADLITAGYRVLGEVIADYRKKRDTQTFDRDRDVVGYRDAEVSWLNDTLSALQGIFPCDREAFSLIHVEPSPLMEVGVDVDVNVLENRLRARVRELESLADNALNRYTDLPIGDRLYIEDIDSFRKVRDVNPHMVDALLAPGGYFDVSENAVQLALEQILAVPLHQQDWGGEANDLYTANVIVNGDRRATAFMLKGNGLRVQQMEIRHCGKNGDQLVRLLKSPAELFVVQFVGSISQAVVDDVAGKVGYLRSQGKRAWYCIIDGQDTARLMRAYGKA